MSCSSEAWSNYQQVNKRIGLSADAAEKVFDQWKFNPGRCLGWIREKCEYRVWGTDWQFECPSGEIARMKRILAEYGCCLDGLAILVGQSASQVVHGLRNETGGLHEAIQEWVFVACFPGGELLRRILILR